MQRISLFVLALLLFISGRAQSKDEMAIRQIMADQTAAWNRGSLDDFMKKGYWESDSLMFIGKSGINYGYTAALNRYRKDYSDREKMGTLYFTLLRVDRLSADYYSVIGNWLLKRKIGDVGGVYTLVFRKIGGRWVIVVDHTS